MITTVKQGNFNLASQDASGLDVEANYRFAVVADRGVPGSSRDAPCSISKYYKNVSDDGVTDPIDAIGGYNQDIIGNASLTYTLDRVSVGLHRTLHRRLSDRHHAVECQTGCPASTEAYRTYDNIDLKGATYLDLSTSYRLDSLFGNDAASGRLYFNIRNLGNKDRAGAVGGDDEHQLHLLAFQWRSLGQAGAGVSHRARFQVAIRN